MNHRGRILVPNLEILRHIRKAKSMVTQCHKTLTLDGCGCALSYQFISQFVLVSREDQVEV